MDFEMEEVSTKEAFQKEKKKLLPSSIRFFWQLRKYKLSYCISVTKVVT